jgi:hypothetical protein
MELFGFFLGKKQSTSKKEKEGRFDFEEVAVESERIWAGYELRRSSTL